MLNYVSSYYSRATYVEAYRPRIYQVPKKNLWRVPVAIANMNVLPNLYVRMPGRPRVRRLRRSGEPSDGNRSRRCPHCGLNGHTGPQCPDLEEG